MSTWINPPPLGRNFLHCIKFPHKMVNILLNLTLGEPCALVNKFSFFENLIELYVMLIGSIHICVHDIIHCILHNVVRIEFYRGQMLNHL
jgi:hypothetical protein